MDLYFFLEKALNAPIDLVTTNDLSPYIGLIFFGKLNILKHENEYLKHILDECEFILNKSHKLAQEQFFSK